VQVEIFPDIHHKRLASAILCMEDEAAEKLMSKQTTLDFYTDFV
jgi:hypothetical protein